MRRGMTLVELLVVLVILAGLTVAVVSSAAATRERARVERVARDGHAMVEALTRAEGLSLISDLGRLPKNSGELTLLFTQQFTADTIETNEEGSEVTVETVLTAPGYAFYTSPLVPATTTPQWDAATLPTLLDVTNRFEVIQLGAGWRGPYCEGDALDTEEDMPVLRDAFGGLWEATEGDPLSEIISRGRDHLEDALRADTTEVAWQDRDQTFEVHLPSPTLTVVAESCDSDQTIAYLHVFLFQPTLTLPKRSTGSPTMSLACLHGVSALNGTSVTLSEGLTLGTRALFVCARTTEGSALVAPPRPLVLKPGNNTLTLTLVSPSAYTTPSTSSTATESN